MTGRRTFALLWLALALAVPLPFFLLEIAREPVAAMAVLLAVMLVWIVTEGAAGAVSITAWLMAGQLLAWAAVLAAVAAALTRVAGKLAGPRGPAVVAVLVVAMLAVAMMQPIYRTPFRGDGLHATLTEVLE